MRPQFNLDRPSVPNPEDVPQFEPSGYDESPNPLKVRITAASTIEQARQILAEAETAPEE